MTNQLTGSNSDEVKNLFLIKFLEMRAKGPSSNFMPFQRFLWALLYCVPLAMKLFVCESSGSTEHILIVSILGFRLVAFAAITIINCLYEDEWLTEKVYKRWIFSLTFEGTIYGILLFGKERFFKDHKIVPGQ